MIVRRIVFRAKMPNIRPIFSISLLVTLMKFLMRYCNRRTHYPLHIDADDFERYQ